MLGRPGITRERVAATNRKCAAIGLAAKPQTLTCDTDLRQRPYFTAATKVMMNAVATANSAATKHNCRSLICQVAMSDPPQAARAYAPPAIEEAEIVSKV